MAPEKPNVLTPPSLPDLIGRVAVLGGNDSDKTALNVALALRHSQAYGAQAQGAIICVCLDARHHKQTEIQFRLLLRDNAEYIRLPASGRISPQISQTILKLVNQEKHLQEERSQSIEEPVAVPPLLLLDGLGAGETLEPMLSFILKAGATVVSLLTSAEEFVFGRYDTVLVLRAEGGTAEAISRAVGRKLSPEDIAHLPATHSWLIHLTRVYQVVVPVNFD